MSLTEFAMVEELAFLVKDNLTCKHLVLSVEEALVDFLQNGTRIKLERDNQRMSSHQTDAAPAEKELLAIKYNGENSSGMIQNGILELEPMSSYSRLLLHRLADIFGFAHASVGEGDDRHLILERCPESSIPQILVSDILSEYDENECPPTSHQLLRRKEAMPALNTNPTSFRSSLEEREAAYLAARDRIFSVDNGGMNDSITPKPRNVPVVARRMIAHALGQGIRSTSLSKASLPIEGTSGRENNNDGNGSPVKISQEMTTMSCQKGLLDEKRMHGRSESNNTFSTPSSERKVGKNTANSRSSNGGAVPSGSSRRVVCEDSLKRENVGAARRIFAHALGLQGTKGVDAVLLRSNEVKAVHKE